MNTPELSIATAPPASATSRRQQIIDFLASRPGVEMSATDIVAGVNLPYSQTTALLSQMSTEPMVSRVRRGTYVYGLPEKVWAETYVSQGGKRKAKKAPAKNRAESTAPRPVAVKAQRTDSPFDGYSVVGTVLRSPSGELMLLTSLPSEVAALLG